MSGFDLKMDDKNHMGFFKKLMNAIRKKPQGTANAVSEKVAIKRKSKAKNKRKSQKASRKKNR